MSNPKNSPSGQERWFTRSQSDVTVLEAKETQRETAERRSVGSSMEPLSSTGEGKLFCGERSHSLPSGTLLSQNCLDLRSTESNPVLSSRTDVERNSKLVSAKEPTLSDAKVGKENLSRADKV